MAATGIEVTTQLPPPQPRPWGRYVDVADQLSTSVFFVEGQDRLGLGLKHVPWGCGPLLAGNLDCSADYLLNGDGAGADSEGVRDEDTTDLGKSTALREFEGVVVHPAFKVVDGFECSVLSMPDTQMVNHLNSRMRTIMSHMLMGELALGWASNGPSLNSAAATLAASADMDDVAQAIEGHLALTLSGNRGVVYLPPQVVHLAVDAGWVHLEKGMLTTATGHQVVADSGFLGDPTDPADPVPSTFTIFASGQTYYRVSDPKLLGEGSETFVRASDLRQRLAEAFAQLAFNPCAVGATVLTLS